ncbi:hypothetical protein EYF80_003636 [Liparis tanakae]|uniref:Uncharacterized protein n=1 Tax=Liparis tanakae TaxID=230148 RepID=A0A4Z2J7Q6_9TELE|nr:hypothetical protein EYF80_003636 [Liparis tanakae]
MWLGHRGYQSSLRHESLDNQQAGELVAGAQSLQDTLPLGRSPSGRNVPQQRIKARWRKRI